MRFKILIFIHLLITWGMSLYAQNNNVQQYQVTGKIINQSDKKPVQGASVFLGNATIGAETNNDGEFSLRNVKPGKYTLIVSVVGFEIFAEPISVVNTDLTLPAIEIMPAIVTLGEVKIKANAGKGAYSDWAHETFLKEFLGTSEYAKDCKILNPEVLNIEYDQSENKITASSSDFLLIENDALGYNIKYKLDKFVWSSNNDQSDKSIHYEGSVFFQEMKGTPRQAREWKQNRQDIYGNSVTHFLRAALNDDLDAEGFRALRLANVKNPARPDDAIINKNLSRLNSKTPINKDSVRYWERLQALPRTTLALLPKPLAKADIISNSDKPGIFQFGDGGDAVVVMFSQNGRFVNPKQLSDLNNLHYIINKAGNKEFTLIDFNEPYALFDNNGGIFNPNSMTFEGAWITNRVASLLPIDYDGKSTKTDGAKLKVDTLLQNTIKATNAYNAANPVEKVYLHLDKQYYLPGDTIWFKAYSVAGTEHQLSDISRVLYTELIDKNDKVISRHIIRLTSGLGIGDFDLPATSAPGFYRVRAYTNYMRNAGVDYFYTQFIQIGGNKQNTTLAKSITSLKPDVQFFPESGYLVDGLTSKVAVKAINANGLGENTTGEIIDNAGNQVTTFSTTHLGMGAFYFKPENGKKYSANVTGINGVTFGVNLPAAHEKGFNLAITNQADNIDIKITANDGLLKNNKGVIYYLLAQSRGTVFYSAAVKLMPEFTFQVAKKRFPSGIAQLTLLSQNGEPLNERVIFIRNNDSLKLSLATTAHIYVPRQKVTVNMSTGADNVAPGSFSVAVINESRVPVNENSENTILNSLLLTSDLKGYVEQPNYYFLHNDTKTEADLDLLMLTQGYRRYEWKNTADTSRNHLTYKSDTSLSLKGSIVTHSGKPVPGAKVTLVVMKQHLFTDTTANTKGNFVFSDIALPDSTPLVIRGNKPNNSENVDVKIDQPDYAAVTKTPINVDTINIMTPEMLKNREDQLARLKQITLRNGVQLKEVKITAAAIHKPVLTFSANLNGPGNADQVIMGDNLIGCIDLATCLNGKVFGVRFKGGNAYNNRAAQRFGSKNGSGAKDAPPLTVIIDGMITHENLNDVSVLDIYSIEVLRSGAYAAIYGSEASTGALVITTKRGNEPRKLADPTAAGLITYPFKGYYLAKTFYSPKYDVPQAVQTTDARSTIYWQPDIITDKDGKASFEYYNADTKGTYRIVVEGIDENGNIGRQVYRYKVQ